MSSIGADSSGVSAMALTLARPGCAFVALAFKWISRRVVNLRPMEASMTRTLTAPHTDSAVMTAPPPRLAGMSSCHSVAHANAVPTTTDLAGLYAAQSGPAPLPRGTREPQEVHVTLDARETRWELAPGKTVTAWGYQGTVPG